MHPWLLLRIYSRPSTGMHPYMHQTIPCFCAHHLDAVCHWCRPSAGLVGSGSIPVCCLHWLRHRQPCRGRPGHEGQLPLLMPNTF